jgi:hypothetical protein
MLSDQPEKKAIQREITARRTILWWRICAEIARKSGVFASLKLLIINHLTRWRRERDSNYRFALILNKLLKIKEARNSKTAQFAVSRYATRTVAESEGFEPPIPFQVCRFSRPMQSTALPTLRAPYHTRKGVVLTLDVFGAYRLVVASRMPATFNFPSAISLSNRHLRNLQRTPFGNSAIKTSPSFFEGSRSTRMPWSANFAITAFISLSTDGLLRSSIPRWHRSS